MFYVRIAAAITFKKMVIILMATNAGGVMNVERVFSRSIGIMLESQVLKSKLSS
jgi:hypothetical protein